MYINVKYNLWANKNVCQKIKEKEKMQKKIPALMVVALIVLSMFSAIAAEATVRAGSTNLTSSPCSTPIVPGENKNPENSTGHWWMIDYWANTAGGNLPSFMNGSFVAVTNTIGGLASGDAILYLPLNVAYGTSATNCVWFQFDIQFNSTGGVSWFIWDIEGPGTNWAPYPSGDYHNTPIGIPYKPGDGYSFSLKTSGTSTVTFSITDTTTKAAWSTSSWVWTVPSLNMLFNQSMFSPASAVEGYTTNSQLTSVPHFQTLVGYGITNFWYGTYPPGSAAPSGIATYVSQGPSGYYYWSMYNAGYVMPSVSISPASVTLPSKGQSGTFTSSTSGGTPSYSYQWYLNGNPYSGATNPSWTFTPSTPGSSTVYLEVTDSVGFTTTSNTATVSAGYNLLLSANATVPGLVFTLNGTTYSGSVNIWNWPSTTYTITVSPTHYYKRIGLLYSLTCQFVQWSDGCTSATRTITLNQNENLIADYYVTATGG
jgi:hypothetical protein